MDTMIQSFNEINADRQALAGGKGATLSRLYQAGYPVPDGFVILPAAFSGDELRPAAWEQVQAQLKRLRKSSNGMGAFAVRSSALSEDSAQASFAGEFETVLDVHTYEAVRAAIYTVRQSRHSERVLAYSQAKGLGLTHEMAVLVQRLVKAEISGVLFTADPVTGDHMRMVGNFVFGFGEELVSGEAVPGTFTLSKPKGQFEGPGELGRYARKLYRLAERLEEDLGGPQDIEWAISGGKLFLLQSRPVTTLVGHNPATGEWNDTLTGDFLWSNTNLMEAVPDVMTPLTFSIWHIFHTKTAFYTGRYFGVGNICGRPYANVSLVVSFYGALGKNRQDALQVMKGTIGDIPDGMRISLIPIRRLPFLLNFIPSLFVRLRKARKILKEMPEYIESSPLVCERMKTRVRQEQTKAGLASLWRAELEPYYLKSCWMLRVSAKTSIDLSTSLALELTELVGEADANTLLLHVGREASGSGDSYLLESLGPLVNLSRVARGEMSRESYLEKYGHRGPHECELAFPSPAEDPGWINQQLAEFKKMPFAVDKLLERQRAEFNTAWARFQERFPGKVKPMARRLEMAAEEARQREAVRSEITRFIGVIRAFALRAGEITGIGEGVFFLYMEELLDLLAGDGSMLEHLPARRETHAKYSALPPYPALVNGRFDPFEWASDPDRRSDYYDSHATLPYSDSDTISGFAGASGRVEGSVRRLDRAEEGGQLREGEILVTATTNVGWTPLFPRAAAIVTDVGAPLSHAAIVARELGIPAVVGCGDATMRLRTGDRVLVDGGRGIVEILDAS